jgi:hypothetical protein
MLSSMSRTIIIASAVILVLTLLALWRWIVVRLRSRHNDDARTGRDKGPRRFDTTMGELRDLREALGPGNSAPPDRRG